MPKPETSPGLEQMIDACATGGRRSGHWRTHSSAHAHAPAITRNGNSLAAQSHVERTRCRRKTPLKVPTTAWMQRLDRKKRVQPSDTTSDEDMTTVMRRPRGWALRRVPCAASWPRATRAAKRVLSDRDTHAVCSMDDLIAYRKRAAKFDSNPTRGHRQHIGAARLRVSFPSRTTGRNL